MTDIHSEIKGLRKDIQKDLEPRTASSTPNWKELISIAKSERSKSEKPPSHSDYFRDSASIIKNPLDKPLDYRICDGCGKPVSLSAIVEHLQTYCKGLPEHPLPNSVKVEEQEQPVDMSPSSIKKKITLRILKGLLHSGMIQILRVTRLSRNNARQLQLPHRQRRRGESSKETQLKSILLILTSNAV